MNEQHPPPPDPTPPTTKAGSPRNPNFARRLIETAVMNKHRSSEGRINTEALEKELTGDEQRRRPGGDGEAKRDRAIVQDTRTHAPLTSSPIYHLISRAAYPPSWRTPPGSRLAARSAIDGQPSAPSSTPPGLSLSYRIGIGTLIARLIVSNSTVFHLLSLEG